MPRDHGPWLRLWTLILPVSWPIMGAKPNENAPKFQKPMIWETPAKIWALVTAVIAAVVGYQARRELAKPKRERCARTSPSLT